MRYASQAIAVARRVGRWAWQRTARSELGEGVISAAIAVLIMAFLGVGMWFGFRATLGNTQKKVDNQVTQIGTDNGGVAPSGSGAPPGANSVGGTGVGVGGAGGGGGGTSGQTPSANAPGSGATTSSG